MNDRSSHRPRKLTLSAALLLGLILAAVALVPGSSARGEAGPAEVDAAAKKKSLPDFRNVAKKWKDGRDITREGDEPCIQDDTDPWDFKTLKLKLKKGKLTILVEYFGPWVVGGDFFQEKGLVEPDSQNPPQPLESQALRDFGLSIYAVEKGKGPKWGSGTEDAFASLTTVQKDSDGFVKRYGVFLQALFQTGETEFGPTYRDLFLGKVKAKFAKKMKAYSVTIPLKKLTEIVGKPKKLRGLNVGVSTNCRTAAGDYIPGGTWARFGGTEGTITTYGKTGRAFLPLKR